MGSLPFRTIFILWLMLYVSRHQRLSSSRTCAPASFPSRSTSPLSSGNSGRSFPSLPTGWRGGATAVCRTLGLSPQQCRQLRPLSTKNLVAILKGAGVSGPKRSVTRHHLVRRSRLSGASRRCSRISVKTGYDLREVCHGRVLADWVDSTFSRLIGKRAMQLLAAFSVGGDAGMPVNLVASVLGYAPGDIYQDMTQLALGGIVYDLDNSTLSVLPEPLRCVLVHDHFFRGPVPLPLDRLLEAAPCLGAACKTLVGQCEGLLSRHVNFWGCSTKPTTDVHGNSSCGAMRRMLVWCLITVPI